MPELTLRLHRDPATGKRTIIVRYRSDEDALPLEHEEEHRRIVDRLIEGGTIAAGEAGRVVIEREGGGAVAEEPRAGEEARVEERRRLPEGDE